MSERREAPTAAVPAAQDRAGVLGLPPWRLLMLAGALLLGGVAQASPAFQDGFVQPWTRGNARAAALLLRSCGLETATHGTLLALDDATLDVRAGCNGLVALLLLGSAILAFPAPWRWRLGGILVAAALVFALNAMRLCTLLLIARYLPARLEFFHLYVWQPLMALAAFAIFLGWGHRVAVAEGSRAAHG
jgi:exosortase/archaeosortase family protein